MSDITRRKAINLTAGQTLSLLAWADLPENAGTLGMSPADRDLQCLLDVYHALQESGHASLGAWRAKRPDLALTAVWKADQAQSKRGL
jgi:hypothetical protein